MTIEPRLLHTIKAKKPLHQLDDPFVLTFIHDYYRTHPTIKKKLDAHDPKTITKAKAFRQIVKDIRNELNRIYGVFWTDNNLELQSHASTKERYPIYPELYKNIFAITGIPHSIVDLAAGLNPLSYPHLNGFHGTYTAIELTTHDCERLRTLFTQQHLPITVLQRNIFTDPLPEADMYFMFKILDTLETKGHKKAEALTARTPAHSIIASFATTTLRGMPMRHPHRGWFDRMLHRLGYHYTILTFPNEIFYVITKA